MRGLLFSLFFSSLLFCSCQRNYELRDPMERTLTIESAQEDFRAFRKILETAHPSLTLYKKPERMNFIFDSVLKTITKRISRRDLLNKYYFITNEAGCSHTDFYLPEGVYDTLRNRAYFFPLPVLLVENKLLVNAVRDDLGEGKEIVEINNVPVEQILKELRMYNSVEGAHRRSQLVLASRDFSYQYYLLYGSRQSFTISYTDSSRRISKKDLAAITYDEWNDRNSDEIYYYDDKSVDYDLRIDEDQHSATMRISTFDYDGYSRKKAFEHFCANSFELLQKKKNINSLIIDVRDNGGGNMDCLFYLYSFITDSSFHEFDRAFSKINTVPFRNWLTKDFLNNRVDEVNSTLGEEFTHKSKGLYFFEDSLINVWKPDPIHFSGKVFVVTNESTFSAASWLALLVKYSGRGKVVGDETGGGAVSGNGFRMLRYRLPESGIVLNFPYVHIVYSTYSGKNMGRGVMPDYWIPDTYESFIDNKDRQIAYITDSLLLN